MGVAVEGVGPGQGGGHSVGLQQQRWSPFLAAPTFSHVPFSNFPRRPLLGALPRPALANTAKLSPSHLAVPKTEPGRPTAAQQRSAPRGLSHISTRSQLGFIYSLQYGIALIQASFGIRIALAGCQITAK